MDVYNMKKSLLAVILATAVASASFQANAAVGHTWNVGVGLGISTINDSDLDWSHTRDDSSATQYKTYLEYNFNDYIGLGFDLSYFENTDNYYNPRAIPSQGKADWKTTTLGTYAKIAYPLDQIGSDIFVKLGIAYNSFEVKCTDTSSYDDTVASALLGIGGNYKFTQNIGVRVGVDYNSNVHHYRLNEDAKEKTYTYYAAFDYTF